MTTLEGALAYMRDHNISATYLASGSWWGDYNLTIEPQDFSNPVVRPQMDVLVRHSAEEQDRLLPLLQGRLIARVRLTKPILEVSMRLEVSTTLLYSLNLPGSAGGSNL